MFVHYFLQVDLTSDCTKIILDLIYLYSFIPSDRTNVVSRSVMKNTFHDNITLTTDV